MEPSVTVDNAGSNQDKSFILSTRYFSKHTEQEFQKQEATATEETISLHQVDSRKQIFIKFAPKSGRCLNYRKPKFPNSVSYSQIEMRSDTIIFPLMKSA